MKILDEKHYACLEVKTQYPSSAYPDESSVEYIDYKAFKTKEDLESYLLTATTYSGAKYFLLTPLKIERKVTVDVKV